MRRNGALSVVFVATDVHFAAQLPYDLDGDGDTLFFHELVSGPLSAVRAPSPTAFDPTLHPVVLYAEEDIFNYGTIRIGTAARRSPRCGVIFGIRAGRSGWGRNSN